jgi:DNA-binding IclR family transcriptional regulator
MSVRHDPGVSVTARVLRLLDAFSPEWSHLTLSQLSRRADLPLSTAHRLVEDLTRWGALERDEQGRYRIGLRLWEVGALAPRGIGLREAAMPFLEDMYEATHENVQLAVLDGTEALYVERISGRGAVNVLTRVGGRMPLHATGVGLVLLAHAPADLQEKVLAGPLRRFTAKTVTTPHELRRILADIRRTQVAVCDGHVELVALSVAAPVHGPSGEVVAAVSVVVHMERRSAPYVPVVRAAARGIARVLGAPKSPTAPGPQPR